MAPFGAPQATLLDYDRPCITYESTVHPVYAFTYKSYVGQSGVLVKTVSEGISLYASYGAFSCDLSGSSASACASDGDSARSSSHWNETSTKSIISSSS